MQYGTQEYITDGKKPSAAIADELFHKFGQIIISPSCFPFIHSSESFCAHIAWISNAECLCFDDYCFKKLPAIQTTQKIA